MSQNLFRVRLGLVVVMRVLVVVVVVGVVCLGGGGRCEGLRGALSLQPSSLRPTAGLA